MTTTTATMIRTRTCGPSVMLGGVAHLSRGRAHASLRGPRFVGGDRTRLGPVVRAAPAGPGEGAQPSGAFTPELKAAADRLIAENKVVLFMKGTKYFPQCGFSNTCVQILNALSVPFEDVNILEVGWRSLRVRRPPARPSDQSIDRSTAPSIDVLTRRSFAAQDERLRTGMKEYSQWPTFPQVYVDGEFFGGCDILLEAYESGELQETMERVLAS